MRRGDARGASRGVERFADADERRAPVCAGALDDRVAIGVERRVGEMGVAVDELRHACTNRRARRRFVKRVSARASARTDGVRGAVGRVRRALALRALALALPPCVRGHLRSIQRSTGPAT